MNELTTEFIVMGLAAVAMTFVFLIVWFSDHKKRKHHHDH